MAIEHLDQNNFDSKIASGDVLVDFWATWCGPCRMQAPILEQFDAAKNGAVKVFKVDVDDNPAIAQRFGVMSIPTLIAFRDGKQLNKSVGVTDESGLEALFG